MFILRRLSHHHHTLHFMHFFITSSIMTGHKIIYKCIKYYCCFTLNKNNIYSFISQKQTNEQNK